MNALWVGWLIFGEQFVSVKAFFFLNDRKDAKNQQGTERVAPHLQRETYSGVFAFCVICMRIFTYYYTVWCVRWWPGLASGLVLPRVYLQTVILKQRNDYFYSGTSAACSL